MSHVALAVFAANLPSVKNEEAKNIASESRTTTMAGKIRGI